MVLNSSSSKRPMGGQLKSEASSLSSPDVRALWEEPTEAISQKPARGRRNPLPSGRGGCQIQATRRARGTGSLRPYKEKAAGIVTGLETAARGPQRAAW